LFYNDVISKSKINYKKSFFPIDNKHTIAAWRKTFYRYEGKIIGYMVIVGPSMRDNNITFISLRPSDSVINKGMVADITEVNLKEMCIYLTVRHAITQTWLNDRDQFLYPNDNWKNDIEFQNNCIIATLFHSHNSISAKSGVNHWIPFIEKEVSAREKFESNFMSEYLKSRTLSTEAHSVLGAGKELWKYYHVKVKNNKTISVNASFYDIREYFQGRNDSGTMNSKSNDETYNVLIKTLREKLHALNEKIQPKVYEYGFLKW
jgi:hypothetical protein